MNYRIVLIMLLAATEIQAAGDTYVVPYNTSVDDKGNLQVRLLLYQEKDGNKYTAYTTYGSGFSQSYGPGALRDPVPSERIIEDVANITRRVFGIVDPANVTDQALADTTKDLAKSTAYLNARSKGLGYESKVALIPVPYIPAESINKAATFDGKDYKFQWFLVQEVIRSDFSLGKTLRTYDRNYTVRHKALFAPTIVYLPRYAPNGITTFLLQNQTNQDVLTLTKNFAYMQGEDYYTENVFKSFGQAVNKNDTFTIGDNSMKYYTYYPRDWNDRVFVSFNLDDAAKKDFEAYVTSIKDTDFKTNTEKARSIAPVAGGTLYAWAGLTAPEAPIATTDKKSLTALIKDLKGLQSPEGQAFIGSMVPADQRPKVAPTPVVTPQPNKNTNQGQQQQPAAGSADLAAALTTLAEKLNDLGGVLQATQGTGEQEYTGEGEWPPKK